MSLVRSTLVVAIAAVLAATASAQTIQLPTYSYTTVATTVSVPDRGSVSLGGVSRSRSASTSLGTPLAGKLPVVGRPFRSRAFGRELSGSSMSVHAYIHDFEAMDRALLAQAAAKRARAGIVMRVDNGRKLVGDNLTVPNRVAVKRQEAAGRQELDDELADLWSRAQAAEAQGKRGVAKIFYRMIARDATGKLKERAMARMQAIDRHNSEKLAATR